MAAEERDMNRDPITDEPGAHPVGTGVGASGGAVTGAAIGAVGGPIGMAIGGVVGAVAGGLAGKAAAESINPTAEEAYWRGNYDKESYYESGRSYDDYSPAYKLGMDTRTKHQDKDWDAVEPRLASDWDSNRAGSTLTWPQAKSASRAAWDRVDTQYRSSPGYSSSADRGMSSTTGSMGTTGAMGSTAASMATGSLTGGMPTTDSSYGSGALGSDRGRDTGTTAFRTAGVDRGDVQSGDLMDNDDISDVLEDLAENCKDGEYGMKTCAERADRADLKSLFTERAEGCRKAAEELYTHIRRLGGEPDEGGTTAGAMHRGWVSVKAAFTTKDDKSVLEEAERGEDASLARYRKALNKQLPADVRSVVERQMQGAQKNHDQIKMLRDQFRAASN